jgi:hypothetical protein
MSALEQSVITAAERRGAIRLRVDGAVPVTVGRGSGYVVDISETGIRVRHSVPLTCHQVVRIAFEWHGERFCASADVMGCRIASLGTSDGEGALYESRLRFRSLAPEYSEILSRILATLKNRDLRKWVANLRGWTPEPEAPQPRRRGAFVRCRRYGLRWERKWTRDATQPAEGFLLPADIDPQELDRLCATYDSASEEGRRLMRLIADAVVRYAMEP